MEKIRFTKSDIIYDNDTREAILKFSNKTLFGLLKKAYDNLPDTDQFKQNCEKAYLIKFDNPIKINCDLNKLNSNDNEIINTELDRIVKIVNNVINKLYKLI